MPEKAITRFDGPFRFLSNFYYVPINIQGITYPTTEHAFQAMKTDDDDIRLEIAEARTPGVAKRLGRSLVVLQDDWAILRKPIMKDLIRIKFQKRALADKLLATGSRNLIEGNSWGDRYWGCVKESGSWVGENHLGLILMETRRRIQRRK